MRLSAGVEWGLHVCTVLALLPADAVLPRDKLAELHELPPAYLAKHLQAMARAGIVAASYGAGGGYRLARPADGITVLDVVRAVDGPEPAFRCTEIRRKGPTALPDDCYDAACTIAAVMFRAEQAWRAELRRTTVADLATTMRTAVDPRQRASARDWLRANARGVDQPPTTRRP